MKQITSFPDLQEKIRSLDKSFLLLYKSGSDQSMCAFRNLDDAIPAERNIMILTADVTAVRDIHTEYGITSVPALLIFEETTLTSVIKGCQESGFYRALTENAIFQARAKAEGKTAKHVTVYSTPTCSWCNTLKAWLRKNSVPFSDVDISRDQHVAEELVRRTGQQGVPQTDINGQIVVGFNQTRLKELLEI